MIFYATIVGDKVAEYKLRRMGTAAVRARPAMRRVAFKLMEIERKVFLAQGRRGGGSWARISDEWLNRKIRMGLDPRINIASGALMRSMSVPEAPHQNLHIGDTRVLLGSDLPYAEAANRERPFTRLTEGDRIELGVIISTYLIEKFRKP